MSDAVEREKFSNFINLCFLLLHVAVVLCSTDMAGSLPPATNLTTQKESNVKAFSRI